MIFSFANQKGGVGKTTTTISLASILAKKKFKVLLIDLDPQSNLTSGVGYERKEDYKSTYDVMIKDHNISEIFIGTDISDNLFLAPAKIDLAASEVELVPKLLREKVLKEKIGHIKNDFDFIFIDCPPSLGLLTINALVASDRVLIPVQCEYFALEGISQLLNTINLVQSSLNSRLEIGGVVMTMYDSRTRLSNEVVNEVQGYFKDKIFDTVIPRNVRISEAPSYGKPIDVYDKNSLGAKAYDRLAEEFVDRFNITKEC